ncbi:hypothetical protein MUK42_32645 [Musa troglodytarum]|uniref:Uncharacterized protein n=1 Tax=Musa troglodytarum TaxID=320322 RepID=A0A9E7I9V8_9LILI|nr:hypothetical protein MUK42_32645 [Musa troglodytarum]
MVSASTDRRLLHPSTLSPLIRNIMRGTSLVALVDVIRQIRRRQAEHIPLDLQVEDSYFSAAVCMTTGGGEEEGEETGQAKE